MKPQTPSQSRPRKPGNKGSVFCIFLSAVAVTAWRLHKLHTTEQGPPKTHQPDPGDGAGEGMSPERVLSPGAAAVSAQQLPPHGQLSCRNRGRGPCKEGFEGRECSRSMDFVGAQGAAQGGAGWCQALLVRELQPSTARGRGTRDPPPHGNHQGHA